jgi:hypothetical protein
LKKDKKEKRQERKKDKKEKRQERKKDKINQSIITNSTDESMPFKMDNLALL